MDMFEEKPQPLCLAVLDQLIGWATRWMRDRKYGLPYGSKSEAPDRARQALTLLKSATDIPSSALPEMKTRLESFINAHKDEINPNGTLRTYLEDAVNRISELEEIAACEGPPEPGESIRIQGEIITDGASYPIQPHDIISRDEISCGRFGNAECEGAAHAIIGLCKAQGSWAPLRASEIRQALDKNGVDFEDFQALVEPSIHNMAEAIQAQAIRKNSNPTFPGFGGGFLVKQPNGRYAITTGFIEHCAKP